MYNLININEEENREINRKQAQKGAFRMAVLLPQQKKIMEKVGEQIRLARLRRKLSVDMVAERANISRATLWKIEKGNPSVAIGSYLKVLNALGLQKDMEKLAADDMLRRTLFELGVETKPNSRFRK